MSCFKNHFEYGDPECTYCPHYRECLMNACDRDRYRYAVAVNRFNTNSREGTRRKMFGEYID